MAVEGPYKTQTVKAGQDLSGHRYKAVNLAGTVAEASAPAIGIVRNAPNNGDHATVIYQGRCKVLVGAAVASNSLIGVTTSGFFITVTGSDYVGKALASAGSGSLCEAMVDFYASQATA